MVKREQNGREEQERPGEGPEHPERRDRERIGVFAEGTGFREVGFGGGEPHHADGPFGAVGGELPHAVKFGPEVDLTPDRGQGERFAVGTGDRELLRATGQMFIFVFISIILGGGS